MNGIEKITERIAAEAEAEAAQVLREAEAAAERVRSDFETQAGELRDRELSRGMEELQQQLQRGERAARLEAKKDLLSLKQEMVSAAYDRAREKILALPEGEYVAFLAREAAHAAQTGQEELILSPRDRDALGEKVTAAANALLPGRGLPGGLKISRSARPMTGGVVLRRGAIEVNCGLDSLLELSRGSLDAEVARILFQ